MANPRLNAGHIDTPLSRRKLFQAGTLGLLGLSSLDVARWRETAAIAGTAAPKAKSVIFVFLTGGPSQHDTFDMKPDGPVDFKGEFNPIATRTPGTHICEHLPMLAERSQRWTLVRSLSHGHSGHDTGTYVMLTGRSELPPTYKAMKPQSVDWPSITAVAGYSVERRNNLPSSVVLPEKVYHSNSGTFSGQFAGLLGSQHEPWMIEATDKPHAYHSNSGAFPKYLFDLHKGVLSEKQDWRFEVPNLTLPEGVFDARFDQRKGLLDVVEQQQRQMNVNADNTSYDRMRHSAMSLMADPKVRQAFDVRKADAKTLARYGDNSFGWSLLMARRLIECGVNMVQVNLGNFGSWDLVGSSRVDLQACKLEYSIVSPK